MTPAGPPGRTRRTAQRTSAVTAWYGKTLGCTMVTVSPSTSMESHAVVAPDGTGLADRIDDAGRTGDPERERVDRLLPRVRSRPTAAGCRRTLSVDPGGDHVPQAVRVHTADRRVGIADADRERRWSSVVRSTSAGVPGEVETTRSVTSNSRSPLPSAGSSISGMIRSIPCLDEGAEVLDDVLGDHERSVVAHHHVDGELRGRHGRTAPPGSTPGPGERTLLGRHRVGLGRRTTPRP